MTGPGGLESVEEVGTLTLDLSDGLVDGGLQVFVFPVILGEVLQQVLHTELQGDVHTAAQVKAEVDFLLLDILISIAEIDILLAQGVDETLLVGRSERIDDELLVTLDILAVGCDRRVSLILERKIVGKELLGVRAAFRFGLLVIMTGDESEGKLPDAGDCNENCQYSDDTFTLHFLWFLILNHSFSAI